jgi:hypothetical protein
MIPNAAPTRFLTAVWLTVCRAECQSLSPQTGRKVQLIGQEADKSVRWWNSAEWRTPAVMEMVMTLE